MSRRKDERDKLRKDILMKGTNEGMWTRIWDRGREHAKSRGKRDQRVVGFSYRSYFYLAGRMQH